MALTEATAAVPKVRTVFTKLRLLSITPLLLLVFLFVVKQGIGAERAAPDQTWAVPFWPMPIERHWLKVSTRSGEAGVRIARENSAEMPMRRLEMTIEM